MMNSNRIMWVVMLSLCFCAFVQNNSVGQVLEPSAGGSFVCDNNVNVKWDPTQFTENVTLFAWEVKSGSMLTIASNLPGYLGCACVDFRTCTPGNKYLLIIKGQTTGEEKRQTAYVRAKSNSVVTQKEGGTVPKASFMVNVYPNPFNPTTTMRINNVDASELTQISVYDMNGNLVLEDEATSNESGNVTLSIDLSDYSSGTYYYMVNVRDKSVKGNMTLVK